MKANLFIALKGVAMGIAEVIPGVSGGTIAFITGIYQRLLNSIEGFGPKGWSAWKKEGFKGLWKAIDGVFLLPLLFGMACGIIFGVLVITKLLEHYPEPLWGFFFGLIIASTIFVFQEITKSTVNTWAALALGAIIAFGITIITPVQGNVNLIYVFISGAVAICAMILPGISGSFILLLMGMYIVIIPTLKNLLVDFNLNDFVLISVFAMGCIFGILSFSRFLNYLFKHYRDIVMALMTGFMIGSLNKIWPWQNVTFISDKLDGTVTEIENIEAFRNLNPESFKIIGEQKVFPSNYIMGDPHVLATILSVCAGFTIVILLSKYSKPTNTF